VGEAWTVRGWNQSSRTSFPVATSKLADGGYVAGQQPLPVIRNGVVAWTQPIPSTAGHVQGEVRLMDLSTGRQSTVASGRISSPVFAGPYLVWARIADDGPYSLEAIEAISRRQVTLPDRMRHPASVAYLAGSAQYLAWTSEERLELFVWQVNSARHLDLLMPDTRHHFQFLAGRLAFCAVVRGEHLASARPGHWQRVRPTGDRDGFNRPDRHQRTSRIAVREGCPHRLTAGEPGHALRSGDHVMPAVGYLRRPRPLLIQRLNCRGL
jgi:hypothetical protein